MKKLNKKFKIISALMILVFVLSACSQQPKGVIATVNGVEIPEEEFISAYTSARNAAVNAYGPELLEEASPENPEETMEDVLKRNVLDNLVQVEIIKQDAEKNDIIVDEASIDQQIQEAITVYGGEENFNAALADQGIDQEYFRKYLAESMLMRQYSEKKMSELTPTDEEVQAYFDENQENFTEVDASHILVATKEEADALKSQIDDGADFAALATENSTDEGTKANGGNLGYFKRGDMVPAFEEAAFGMEAGEVSDPIETNYGYHIIKVNDVKTDFEGTKEDVKTVMVNERFEEYLNDLENDADVNKYLDMDKDYAPATETEQPAETAAPEEGAEPAEGETTETTPEAEAETTETEEQ